ncbi:P-loop containing nucleoside triphosphate hydrolase [Vibrio phage 1.081.O._10N.286.52.C2]|nr:P-loop containing nucleoside triphosphate hydrolase [Vibrio phage 1.081.O._10N.286.52.C2]
MTDIKIEYHDESYARVVAEPAIMHEMIDYFSFLTDGYKFNPKFKAGIWDGKIRLMTYQGMIPYGLVGQCRSFASNMMYTIETDEKLDPVERISREDFDAWVKSLDIYSGSTKIEPHWYQADSIFTGINNQHSLLNLPTSAGKSLIQSLTSRWYLENHELKVLIIVPTTALVQQMRDDFLDYRLFDHDDIYQIRGGVDRNAIGDCSIVVSTWQSAVKQDAEWFKQFGMLMVDECHLATGKSLDGIIKKMTNCEYKLGLTGSLRDGKANILQYVGTFGDIFKPVSTAQLMQEGQVTDLKINCLMLEYPQPLREEMKGCSYPEEMKFLLENKHRNRYLIKLSYALSAKRGENTLLLFKNISHGKLLYEALCKIYDPEKVFYVSGETKTDDRTKIKKLAEDIDGAIIVASYGVFATGISIKKLHNVIYAHPTKSKILTLQSIGRVLRKHGSKVTAKLFDIIDNLAIKPKRKNAKKPYTHINYTMNHGMARIELYNQEEFKYSVKKVDLA